MKKILIVISELSLGGTEKQLKNIISELCNEDLFEFNLVTLISKGNYYNEFKKIKNLKVKNLFNLKNKNFIIKSFFALLSIISLTRFIIKKQPDIIHFYLPTSYLIGASTIFFYNKNIKYIMSRRSLNKYQKKYFLVKKYEQYLHNKMHLITGNCQAIISELELENVEVNKLKKIFNGIKISSEVRKKITEKNKINMILLANYIPYKGHKFLIDSFNELDKQYKQKLNIRFYGQLNNYSNFLKSYIDSKELSNFITINPHYLDVSKYIKECDIGISASSEEGLSNSIMEFMNFNMPVIATDVGGTNELIYNNFNGLLVQYGDINSLKLALEFYVNNIDFINIHGNNSKKILQKNFDINNCIKVHKKIYLEL